MQVCLIFKKKITNKNQHQYFSAMIHRNSVPRRPDMTADEMRQFIQQLMEEAEEWKAIKMVVLGHGRIGKTTLLHAINQIMDPSSVQVYSFYVICACAKT